MKNTYKPKVLKCLRCGHKWTQRINGAPRACPGCKSDEWYKYKSSKELK